MPTEKLQISGKSIQYLDGLISNIQNCDHISSGKTIIFNINNMNIDNSINSVNSHNTNITNSENLSDEFIEHIKTEKPKWYTPGKNIDIYRRIFSTL